LETTLINNSFASNPAVNASSAVHSTPYTFPKEHDLATLPIKMEVKDLSIYYNKFKAVEGISLAFPANQITAIIGPSGCGKSTLLRSLNRMTELIPRAHVEGSVFLDGENLYAPGTDVVELRRRIGMVFQRPNPFPMSI
jgi:phosphate transport system ATP-binding protein